MYLENFIVKSIRLRCSSLARNLSFSNERSSCHLYRRFGTATSDHVSRMNSKTEKLYHDICKGERAALGENANLINYASSPPPMFSSVTARGITLVESSHKASSAQSRLLVNRLMIHCKQKAAQLGKPSLAFRIGLSGPPGAGKSTFTGDKSFQQSEDRFVICDCHLQKSLGRS